MFDGRKSQHRRGFRWNYVAEDDGTVGNGGAAQRRMHGPRIGDRPGGVDTIPDEKSDKPKFFAVGGAFWNTTSGPKVPSSGFGPKLPAFKGPATNSQNGSNCWKAARLGW